LLSALITKLCSLPSDLIANIWPSDVERWCNAPDQAAAL
jgi:hypothetical protein